MRYALIQPDDRLVRFVDDDAFAYETIRDAVGGFIDAFTVDRRGQRGGFVGYVNDSGLLTRMTPNFLAADLLLWGGYPAGVAGNPVPAGPMLVAGIYSPTGEYDGETYPIPEHVEKALRSIVADGAGYGIVEADALL